MVAASKDLSSKGSSCASPCSGTVPVSAHTAWAAVGLMWLAEDLSTPPAPSVCPQTCAAAAARPPRAAPRRPASPRQSPGRPPGLPGRQPSRSQPSLTARLRLEALLGKLNSHNGPYLPRGARSFRCSEGEVAAAAARVQHAAARRRAAPAHSHALPHPVLAQAQQVVHLQASKRHVCKRSRAVPTSFARRQPDHRWAQCVRTGAGDSAPPGQPRRKTLSARPPASCRRCQ